MAEPIHLRPSEPLAERVLLPGDPHRALLVAQALLDQPRMFNHARGLWGYTGTAADGELLSIQSTGMGGPSAAIVIEELIDLGARTLIRIGTCGALVEGLELGELVSAREVIARRRGQPRPRGLRRRWRPDPALHAALGAREVTAVSTDLFYDAREESGGRVGGRRAPRSWRWRRRPCWRSPGAAGVAAAVLLAVTDQLAGGSRQRIGAEELEAAGLRLGRDGLDGSRLLLGDGEALLGPRHGLGAGRHGLAQRGDVAGDLIEPGLDAVG